MKKIMLVADDLLLRDTFTLVFPDTDYQVICYANGAALFKSRPAPPDIFLLDRLSSGPDGLDICRQLKSANQTRHIPVIILSAAAEMPSMAHAAGADATIMKPCHLTDLRNTVRAYMC